MRIKQIFNNNAVLTENAQGEEIILLGRGIGFGLSKGQKVQEDRIEKKFELKNDVMQDFKKIIKDIPYEYALAARSVIKWIRHESSKKINDTIYITLTDHIANMVERIKMGIAFDTALLLNVRSLYKEEYKLGLKAVEILREKLKIDIEESEANYIALHIINAELDSNMQQMYMITNVIEEIMDVIKSMFEIKQEDSHLYDRFITHCRFFAQRVVNKEYLDNVYGDENDHMYQILKKEYPKQDECIQQIAKEIESKHEYKVSLNEKLYLILHLVKLTG